MKRTIMMLAFVFTLFLTWMTISVIGWMFSEETFKSIATGYGILTFMIIIGWIPAIIVCVDLDEKYFPDEEIF